MTTPEIRAYFDEPTNTVSYLVWNPDEKRGVPSKVHWMDTTSEAVAGVPERADRVITSPPYPNRYSYVWNTRPHLYMLQIFTKRSEGGDLDAREDIVDEIVEQCLETGAEVRFVPDGTLDAEQGIAGVLRY